MSKKETFERIIAYEVRKALKESYGMTTDLTDKQNQFVSSISDNLYKLFGDSLTVKDLQEKVDAVSKTF